VEKLTLDINVREECGSRQVARLRKEGILPVVVYAHGKEAISASVNAREFVKAAKKARTSTFFVLKSADSRLDGKRALVKEIQQNHLKKEVLHADFIAVDAGTKVRVEVPVEITGESDGVKNFGGVMTVSVYQVLVEGIPDAIPEIFRVDVSPLAVGEHFRVSDLHFPEGCVSITGADQPIVSIMAGAVEEAPVAAEEATAAKGKKGKK